jgi:hypothetical protein
MVRYLALLLLLSMLLSGCVVVHSEKHMAVARVGAEGNAAALP